MEKITKREKFEMLLSIQDVAENEMLVDFINNEINLLIKKNSKTRANGQPTAKQIANAETVEKIINILSENDEPLTIEQITDLMGERLSSQKVSALLRTYVNDEKVIKTKEKGKIYYTVAR